MKTKNRKPTKILKLDGIKVKNRCVYLEESEGHLRVGPEGPSVEPAELARKLPTALRRKLRQQLKAAGHHDVMLQTIVFRQVSKRDQECEQYTKEREALIRKHTNEVCRFCGGDGGNDCRCPGMENFRCEQDSDEDPLPTDAEITAAEYEADREAEIRYWTKGRYQESDHGDTGSHNA